MIAKLIKSGRILLPTHKLSLNSQFIVNFSTQQTPAQQYRDFLLQLNFQTLKNEMVKMKNIRVTQSHKLRKTQIINQLCLLPEPTIEQRLKQIQGKSFFQLQTTKSLNVPFQSQPVNSQTEKALQPTSKNQEYDPSALMKQVKREKIIQKNLQLIIGPKLMHALKYEQYLQSKILHLQYNCYLQQNTPQRQKPVYLNEPNHQENTTFASRPSTKEKPPTLIHPQMQRFKRKAFANLLFKTNDQIVIDQKKRKYLYEEEKLSIIEKFQSANEKIACSQFLHSIRQIKTEKAQNQVMKGFHLQTSKKKAVSLFLNKKHKALQILTGFSHFKQMCTNPYSIRFLHALAFEKDIPLEYTMIKIAEESRLSPETFKKDLHSISKDYFLKVLKISANYVQKVFKRGNTDKNATETQDDSTKDEIQDEEDQRNEDFDEDEDDFDSWDNNSEKKAKTSQQPQKLPNTRQSIDLDQMRFTLSIFEASICRVIEQMAGNKQVYLSEVSEHNSLKENQQKQVKAMHESLQLCFQMYKTFESLLAAVEINDFNDLQTIIQILFNYSHIRIYLQKHITVIQSFMLLRDSQYHQKLQLGLINMVAAKELGVPNFLLKFQARKLNFDIVDNIGSILKHDNVEITLENKRDRVLSVLEKFLKLYLDNQMLEFIEDELIYALMRFLQKQVYMDKKVKGLFESRVNFGESDSQIQSMPDNKQTIDMSAGSPNITQSLFSHLPLQNSLLTTQSASPTSPTEFTFFEHQRNTKSFYYMGQIDELLSKPLLYHLITVVRQKYEKKQIVIEQINNFNLIQEWYSEPTSIRLQFFKQDILLRYHRLELSSKQHLKNQNYTQNL